MGTLHGRQTLLPRLVYPKAMPIRLLPGFWPYEEAYALHRRTERRTVPRFGTVRGEQVLHKAMPSRLLRGFWRCARRRPVEAPVELLTQRFAPSSHPNPVVRHTLSYMQHTCALLCESVTVDCPPPGGGGQCVV